MNQELRVLHVYRTYFPDPPGGLQEAIRQICLATKEEGVVNTIFTLSPSPKPPALYRNEATVVRAKSWGAPASCDLGGFSAVRTFRYLAKHADIVHYYFPWPFADILCLLTQHSAPAMMTYVSDIVRQRWLSVLYSKIMWRMLHAMDVIIANSQAYIETSPILSSPRIYKKVSMVPLGIEEKSYPEFDRNTKLTKFDLEDNESFFLFIGVLRYYKGVDTLIEAALRVKAKVVIAGTGPEEKSLQKLAKRSGASNVIFVGQVADSDKVFLLKKCVALVLPSHLRSEAFGMVLIEAAMYGRPLISCEIGTGTSYVNVNEESGFVVPPQDALALAVAMNVLLEDAGLVESMGRASRKRYEKFFSGAVLGQSYRNIYNIVIENNK